MENNLAESINLCISEVVNFRHHDILPGLRIAIAEHENFRTCMFIERDRFSIHVHTLNQDENVGHITFDKHFNVMSYVGYNSVIEEIQKAIEDLKVKQEQGVVNMQLV